MADWSVKGDSEELWSQMLVRTFHPNKGGGNSADVSLDQWCATLLLYDQITWLLLTRLSRASAVNKYKSAGGVVPQALPTTADSLKAGGASGARHTPTGRAGGSCVQVVCKFCRLRAHFGRTRCAHGEERRGERGHIHASSGRLERKEVRSSAWRDGGRGSLR